MGLYIFTKLCRIYIYVDDPRLRCKFLNPAYDTVAEARSDCNQ